MTTCASASTEFKAIMTDAVIAADRVVASGLYRTVLKLSSVTLVDVYTPHTSHVHTHTHTATTDVKETSYRFTISL